MKVNYEERKDAAAVKIVRHWRLVWTPWGSLSIGYVDKMRSIWIETKNNLWYAVLTGAKPE